MGVGGSKDGIEKVLKVHFAHVLHKYLHKFVLGDM